MTEPQRYRAEDLHKFCCAVLHKLNVPYEDAREAGDCLVLADLRGVDSHGVIRLPVYAGRIRENVVNARAVPRIIRTHAAAALMDGDNGLGSVVGSRAMEKAIALASTAGIGFVGVRRTNHFGIASFYVQKALQQGFIGCAASNAPPHMAPFGVAPDSSAPIPSPSEFLRIKKRLCYSTLPPAWSHGKDHRRSPGG